MLMLIHGRKLSLFVALSLSDLALTWFLLSRRGGAYESNPAAAWWLQQFGWPGLIGFKLVVSVVAVFVVVILARRNARAAGRLLLFACALLLAVVVYSSLLVPEVCAHAEISNRIQARAQKLEEQFSLQRIYDAALAHLTNELMADRCSLSEAVIVLGKTERVHSDHWLTMLSSRFPSYTGRELVAIRLILEVKECPNVSPDRSSERARVLAVQFQARFNRPAPVEFADTLTTS